MSFGPYRVLPTRQVMVRVTGGPPSPAQALLLRRMVSRGASDLNGDV